MPEIRHYIVTQERQVKIWANSPEDAAIVGASVFNGTTPVVPVQGGPESQVRDLGIFVKEDR